MDDLHAAPAPAPTIFEWVGGRAVFRRWFEAFYDLVEVDDLLGPVFGGTVTLEHREHVTDWWCEVMGGPPTYTEVHGGYDHMLARHRGLGIDSEQRLRFVTLLSKAADLAGVPADPECRAAVMGYAEWGTRLAVENPRWTPLPPSMRQSLAGAGVWRRPISGRAPPVAQSPGQSALPRHRSFRPVGAPCSILSKGIATNDSSWGAGGRGRCAGEVAMNRS